MTAAAQPREERIARGIRAARAGLIVNALLALAKLVAGIVGNAYVLIADAVESSTDIFAGMIVWRGLSLARRPADAEYPFGRGKAESMAAAVVALMLLGAAAGITVAAIREIRTPHSIPAPFTLVVSIGVIVIKGVLARRVGKVASEVGSAAVKADAWHHASDAITSVAACIGIAIALIGARWHGGSGWESADDWAALLAAVMIAANGVLMLRPALDALMDRAPTGEVASRVLRAAHAVPGVLATEHLRIRVSGLDYLIDLHVQADPALSLRDAHALSGAVKAAIRAALPTATAVLIHMEPFIGALPTVRGAPDAASTT
ncbi:MAG TPA: cation diffusion facilitator family transporter [Gemmatimonadaceae bacterium]|nr:cation diffusion facilitator family transporter [Gemmatimonadaceae bacterium]